MIAGGPVLMGVSMRQREVWDRRSGQYEAAFSLLSVFTNRRGNILFAGHNDSGLIRSLAREMSGNGRVVF
jgi:hypothetical protein